MKRCHFNKELSAYLDGELAQEERAALEEHLKTCADCRMELSQLERVSRRLKEWHVPGLGPFFTREVKEGLLPEGQEKGEAKMERKRVGILVPATVLVVVLMFVMAGSIYIKRGVMGRIKEAADRAGGQFSPRVHKYAYETSGKWRAKGRALSNEVAASRSGSETMMGFQYEPQYSTARMYADADVGEGAGRYYDKSERSVLYDKAVSSPSSEAENAEEAGQVLIVAPVMPVIGEGEKVIRTASVALEVENGKETYKKVEEICAGFKGHIVSTNFYRNDRGQESGKLVLRVPKDALSTVLDKFNNLGKVENVTVDTKDVSEEYTELSAQLQTAKLVYDKALEALKKRQPSVSDALKTESELTPILLRIENLRNQLERLNNDIAYATITMEFHEAELSGKAVQESAKLIGDSFIKAKIEMIKFFAGIVEMLPAIIFGAVVTGAAIIALVAVYLIIKKNRLG